MKSRIFVRSFIPGAISTPELTSTPQGDTTLIDSATLLTVNPPDKITFIDFGSCFTKVKSYPVPVPGFAESTKIILVP
jgi:hypothetical protein